MPPVKDLCLVFLAGFVFGFAVYEVIKRANR